MKPRLLVIALSVLFSKLLIAAEQKPISQPSQALKLVKQRLTHENEQLQKNTRKQEALLALLAKTEKSIGQLSEEKAVKEQQLSDIKTTYQNKKTTHAKLNQEYLRALTQFKKTIQIRYTTHVSPLMKYLLSPQTVHTSSENLQYYNYVLKSQKTKITHLRHLRHALRTSAQALEVTLKEQQNIAQSLQDKINALAHKKKKQKKLLQNVFQDIKSNKARLERYQIDQQNLSQLIHNIRKAHKITKPLAFAKRRHKLALPVGSRASKQIIKNQGVLIYAAEGDHVKAVHSGKVVFSDWLRGYGLLLIIDHGAGYMTLYAHNMSLKKIVGDNIVQGDVIARVGHSGGVRENGLYFEIRYRGKAISPHGWFG